jgi:hypothetical protein
MRHEKQQSHHVDGEENMSTFCQESIKTLKKIVPKLERQYHASTNPQAEDIGHICDFYEQLIEGDFCPHAPDALRLENGPMNGTLKASIFYLDCRFSCSCYTVLPRIQFLFENLLSFSVMEDTTTTSRTAASSRVFEKICQTVAQLLTMIADCTVVHDIFQDWFELALDLSLLSQSSLIDEYMDQVELSLFDRVLVQSTAIVDNKEEYVLILKTKEHLFMIQSAVTTVLYHLIHLLKEKRLLDAMMVDMVQHNGYDDSYFFALITERPELFEELLAMARRILSSHESEPSKENALRVRSKMATLRLLQMMEIDLRDVGVVSPLAFLRLHFHILIAQAIGNVLQTKQSSSLSKLEASYIRKLAHCLTGSVHRLAECPSDRTTYLALLLNILPSIQTCQAPLKLNPARRALEVAVLRSIHMLLVEVGKCGNAEALVWDHDTLTHLHDLVQDPDFHEYAVWIISAILVMNGYENLDEICGEAMRHAELEDADEKLSLGTKRTLPIRELTGFKKRRKHDEADNTTLRSDERHENMIRAVSEDLLQLLMYGRQSDQTTFANQIKILGGIRIVLTLVEAVGASLGQVAQKWLSRVFDVAFQLARKLQDSDVSSENRVVLRCLVCCGLHVSLIRSHCPDLFANVLETGLPIDDFVKTCESFFLFLLNQGQIEKHPWILDSIFHRCLHWQFTGRSRPSSPLASFDVEVFTSLLVRVSFDGCKVTSQKVEKPSDESQDSQFRRLSFLASPVKLVRPESNLTTQQETCRLLTLIDFENLKPESKQICLFSIQWLLRESSLLDLRRMMSQCNRERPLGGSGLLRFVIDCCFGDDDASIRKTAAEIIQLAFNDGSTGLVPCLLSTDDEWIVLNSGARSTHTLPHLQILDQLVIRFFRNVDELLHSRCCMPQSQLSLTIGSVASSNSEKASKRDRRFEQLVFHCRHATRVLLSFCVDKDDYFMKRVLHSSLTRVVRLWSGPGSLRNETHWISFVELSRWTYRSIVSRVFDDENIKRFVPNLFREVLVPSSTILMAGGRTGIDNIRDGTKERHCLLLSTFIGFLVLSGSADAEGTLIVARNFGCVNDIERFLGCYLPYIFSQFVIEKDYDALRLTTSFKFFILGQKLFESKQRMRVSNDGLKMNYVFDLSLGSPKSTFITSSMLSRVWRHDLEEQTGSLCSSTDLFATLLPLVFTRAGESEIVFLMQTVLRNRLISLTNTIQTNERIILRNVLLEIGDNHYNYDPLVRAFKLIDYFRTLSNEESSRSLSTLYRKFKDNDESHSEWITMHFMYLVVNIVQFRWSTKTDQEKTQSLRSLLFAVRLLDPKESCQYFPQIISTLNAAVALCEERAIRDTEEVLLVAVRILSEFIKIAGESNTELLGQNLKLVVVSLVPVLSESEYSHESSARLASRNVGIEILERLVQGDLGRRLAPYFSDIPFLPSNEALHSVKESLRSLGVDNDTVLSTQGTQDGASSDQSNNDTSKQEALRQRLATVCPLIAHENAGVRRIALKHIIDLLKANRYLFHALLENEGDTSMKHYLTVVKPGTSGT